MKDPKQYSQDIQDNIKKAMEEKYSTIEGRKQVLKLNNIQFDPTPAPDDYERQKAILYKRGTEGTAMYADAEILEKSTGKSIGKTKKMKIGFVPTVTNRHSFIINGKEYIANNQLRLRPAIYTKLDRLGAAQADFNLAKGRNMELSYQPSKGLFTVSVNKSNVPLFSILKGVYKVGDAELTKQFGADMHIDQMKKIDGKIDQHLNQFYDLLYKGSSVPKPTTPDGISQAIREKLDKSIMDPETNKKTLGVGYAKVDQNPLMHAAKEVLAIYQGKKDPSYKDNLAFKSVHSAEDFLYEKFTKLAPQTINKLKFKVDSATTPSRTGIRSAVESHLRGFFIDSDIVNYPMQVNPYEFLENAHKITSLGEGGISSTESLPKDARNLHASQLGFIDFVRTPDNMRAGIDLRLGMLTTKKGDKLVSAWKNAKTGKYENVDHVSVYDKYYCVESEPVQKNGLVRAYHKGNMVEVPKSKIDFLIPSEALYTVTTGALPFLANSQGQRTAMGAKMTTQALSLVDREPPLVDTSANKLITGVYHPKAKMDGTVSKISNTEIHIKGKDGKDVVHFIPHEFPLNYHSYLHSTPLVAVGDKVTAGQQIAEHNFAKDGKMAIGINANVAYMPYKGYNFEDAVVVTETGAKKFSSNHIFQEELEIPDDSVIVDAAKFKAWFPNKYSNAQLMNLSGAVVKKGTKLVQGDAITLALKKKRANPEILLTGKSADRISQPYGDISLSWDKNYPGMVKEVIIQPGFIKVVVEAVAPLQLGDKLCGRYGNKGIVGLIVPDHEAPRNGKGEIPDVILNPAGLNSRMNNGQLFETALGKVLKTKGSKGVFYKNFNGANTWNDIKKALTDSGVKTEDDYIDPITKKKIPKIFNGVQYIYKLSKQTEGNFAARAGGEYDIDMRPVRGGEEGAKAVGNLDFYAVLGYGHTKNILKEMATYKAEYNPELWGAILSGKPLPAPKSTFAWQKVETYLNGMGVNVKKAGNHMQVLPLTDKDVLAKSNGAINDAALVMEKPDPVTGLNFRPEKNGLFDQGLTGGLAGTHWNHIELARPVVNTMYEKPIRSLLNIDQKTFKAVASGDQHMEIDGKQYRGAEAFQKALKKIDVKKNLQMFHHELATTKTLAKKDELRKKIKYLSALDKMNLHPADAYINNVIPIIPPKFRPIYPDEKGKTVVTDANKLYQDVIHFNKLLQDPLSQALGPNDPINKERYKGMHEAVQKLQGLDPSAGDMAANKNRDPSGFLKVLVGTQPKMGFFQSKLMSRVQDLVGRATVAPDPQMGLDQIGLPTPMAWKLYGNFVAGEMVKSGFTLPRAKDEIERQSPVATQMLVNEMKKRPVMLNRAPSLHKHSFAAFDPQLVEGKTIHMSTMAVKGMGMDFDGDSVYSSVFQRFKMVDTYSKLSYNSWYKVGEDNLSGLSEEIIKVKENEMAFKNHVSTQNGLTFLGAFPRIEESKRTKDNTDFYDVPEGVEVLTLGNNQQYKWLKPESFSIHRDLKMVKVKTNRHRSVLCSQDHSLVTLDDKLNITKAEPKEQMLVPIKIKPVYEFSKDTVDLVVGEGNAEFHKSMPLNYDTGYFLGVITGDGWVSEKGGSSHALCLASVTKEITAKWEEVIRKYLVVNNDTVSNYSISNTHDYKGYSCGATKNTWNGVNMLGPQIKEWVGHRAQNKHFPPFFLESPIAFRKGLLAGLIDTDGSVTVNKSGKRADKSQTNINITTTSQQLAFEVVALGNSLGLIAGVTVGKTPLGEVCFTVYFSGDSVYAIKQMLILYHPQKAANLKEARDVDIDREVYGPPLPISKLKELSAIVGNPRKFKKGTQEPISTDEAEMTRIVAKRQVYGFLYEAATAKNGRSPFLTQGNCKNILALKLPIMETDPFWKRWKEWAESTETVWELVVSVEPVPELTEAYDLTIPPDFTMVTESSWVVFDTATVHLPISAAAIGEANQMKPSNNLFHVLDKSLWHLPQQETVMGLNSITTPNQAKPVHTFATTAEAKEAYQAGKIAVNDHIEIKKL